MDEQLIEEISARLGKRYRTEHMGVSIPEIVRDAAEALHNEACRLRGVVESLKSALGHWQRLSDRDVSEIAQLRMERDSLRVELERLAARKRAEVSEMTAELDRGQGADGKNVEWQFGYLAGLGDAAARCGGEARRAS